MNDMKKIGITSAVTLIVLVVVSCAASCTIKPIVYHTYQGPIFLLTAVSDTEGITAERDMKLNFASYEKAVPGESMFPFNEARKVYVEDGYVLTNTTGEDVMVKAVYPFVGALTDKIEWVPEVYVNGTLVDTEIALGRSVWDCVEKYKAESEEAEAALDGKLNVKMFERIASDEEYMQEVFADNEVDAADKVIVYKFKNLGYDGMNKDATSPNLKVRYAENPNADVLPANWDSWGSNEMDGVTVQTIGFDLPAPGEEGYGKDGYLVVLGGDISDVTAECYATSTGSWLEDVDIEMERYESTLEEVAREIFADGYEVAERGEPLETVLSEEELFAGFLKAVCECRDIVRNQEADYYADIDSAWYSLYESQRMMYAVFEVTVPAGESVEVWAVYEKQAGHGVYEEDEELDRYDILPEEYSAFEFVTYNVEAIGSEKCQYVEEEDGVKSFLHP